MVVKPEVVWGSSYGKYDGTRITDYQTNDEFGKRRELDYSHETTLEELAPFYREVSDFVLARLGHPTVRVELTPFQLITCIDEAVERLSFHAPMWTKQYAVFKTVAGQNVYEIPRFILDNLEYVVYKKTLLSIQAQAGTLEFDYFLRYFQNSHLFTDFSIGDFYVLQMHMEMMRKILSQEGSWDVLNNSLLQLNPTPVVQDYCILEYRALDSNTLHPAYRSWIKRFTLAITKGILGQVRGKYKTLPGPGGGAQLNGDDLIAQSADEREKLIEELLVEIEEPPEITTY